MKKGLLITIFILAAFFLAIIVWYSPIIFKGWPYQPINTDILLAKNYYQTGVLANQSAKSVTLAPSLIKEAGRPYLKSEYFGSLLYAEIFKLTGVLDYKNLALMSIILYSIAMAMFSISVLILFDFKTAIVFSLVYIFSPIGWGLAHDLGIYEFCLIFLSLFFVFYLSGRKSLLKEKNFLAGLFFALAGIFLFLASVSKETALVLALAFFIFFIFKKEKKQLISIFVPFCLLLAVFWAPSFLSGKNVYLSLFTSQEAPKSNSLVHLHVFPDAYTYYFEREPFLEQYKNQDLGLFENLISAQYLANYGFAKINFIDRGRIGAYLLTQHLSRFFSLEDFGGPLVALSLILGLFYLFRKDKFIFQLILFWFFISFFVFSFIIMVGRDHLMDFVWAIMILIAGGLIYLSEIISDKFALEGKFKKLFGLAMLAFFLYHLVLVNHVVLGREYDSDFVPRSVRYGEEIEKNKVKDIDVIAIPGDFPSQSDMLCYLTGQSFIVFRSPTIEKLVKDNKLKEAFEFFGVKYVLGYSDKLSEQIKIQTGAVNIASNSLKIDFGQFSENKSFFMNIIR